MCVMLKKKTQDKRETIQGQLKISLMKKGEKPHPPGREGGQHGFIRDRRLEQTNRATNLDVY